MLVALLVLGNGHIFDGLGAQYWDGLGLNGGVTKPAPMLQFVQNLPLIL